MKKLIFITAAIVILFSCKKIMHEELLSIGKLDTKEKLLDATDAIYGMLNALTIPISQSNNGDDLSYYNPNYKFYIDSSYEYSNGHYCMLDEKSQYSGYSYETYWSTEYNIIACINNIILQYNSLRKNKETDQIFGEVYFLRAYTYILLTNRFGRVPIIIDTDINYTERCASFEEIYKQIESDLKKASTLLPGNNTSARIPYVTPCKGTSKAVLAELYLTWAGYPIKNKQKYNDAAREAGELIDSAGYFGYELLPDFAYLWKKDHLYNNESIFSFYCDNYAHSSDKFYTAQFVIQSETNFRATEINFFNNYPKGYRKEITFKTDAKFYKYYFDTTTWIITSRDSVIKHFDKVDPCARIAYRKFFYDTLVIHHYNYDDTAFFNHFGHYSDSKEFFGIGRNYILRYAQILLTYSEAMARSGQLNDKAYQYVNMIRRRARHLPLTESSVYDLPKGLSTEVFADSVVWERAWELCAENNVRWNDLRRLELVEKLPEMRNELEGGPPTHFDKSVYFEPIPAGDLRLNPNLKY